MVGRTVVLVSQDFELAEQLAEALAGTQDEMKMFGHTLDALRYLNRLPADLILIDFAIADGGALSLRERTQDLRPDAEIVLLVPSDVQPEWLTLFDCHKLELPVSDVALGAFLRGEPNPEQPPARTDWSQDRTEVLSDVDIEIIAQEIRDTPQLFEFPTGDAVAGFVNAMTRTVSSLPDPEWANQDVGTCVRTSLFLLGKLESVPLASILHKLFANRMSGILSLRDGQRQIYFREGLPVHATSEAPADAFVNYLIADGWVEQNQVNDAIPLRGEDEDLAETLYRLGSVGEEALFDAAFGWVHGILLGCFQLTEGNYHFDRDKSWFGQVPEFPRNPIELIAEGLYQNLDPEALAEDLETQLGAYLVKTEKYQEFLRFYPAQIDEWAWIAAIDGTRTLSGVMSLSSGEMVRLLTMVHILTALDVLEFSAEPRIAEARSELKNAPKIFSHDDNRTAVAASVWSSGQATVVDSDALEKLLAREREAKGNKPVSQSAKTAFVDAPGQFDRLYVGSAENEPAEPKVSQTASTVFVEQPTMKLQQFDDPVGSETEKQVIPSPISIARIEVPAQPDPRFADGGATDPDAPAPSVTAELTETEDQLGDRLFAESEFTAPDAAAPSQPLEAVPTDESPQKDDLFAEPEPEPTTEEAPQIANAEIEKVVFDYYRRMGAGDPYYLLDVPRNVAPPDAKAAYERFLEKVPKSRIAGLDEASRQYTEEVHEAVERAYNQVSLRVLKSEFETHRKNSGGPQRSERERKYIESLRQASRKGREKAEQLKNRKQKPQAVDDPPTGKRNAPGYAEAYYLKAKKLVRELEWTSALEHIQEAIHLAPHKPKILALQAWILFHHSSGDRPKKLEQCAERLEVALTIDEQLIESHYYLGVIRKKQKRYQDALVCLQNARRLDSKNQFARLDREIKALRQHLAGK